MIEVKRIATDAIVVIIDGPDSMKAFDHLVHRGTNLWPDAPAEIKEFADAITNYWWATGPLQNYQEQDTSAQGIEKQRTKRKEKSNGSAKA